MSFLIRIFISMFSLCLLGINQFPMIHDRALSSQIPYLIAQCVVVDNFKYGRLCSYVRDQFCSDVTN